jgi:hypothetical protein
MPSAPANARPRDPVRIKNWLFIILQSDATTYGPRGIEVGMELEPYRSGRDYGTQIAVSIGS